jgi:hypothetical protein
VDAKSKTMVLFLLAALTLSSASPQGAWSFRPHGHQSPCHQHSPTPLRHESANYACCVSGHNAAIVPGYPSIQTPALSISNAVLVASDLNLNLAATLRTAIYRSGDPPGSLPLRI